VCAFLRLHRRELNGSGGAALWSVDQDVAHAASRSALRAPGVMITCREANVQRTLFERDAAAGAPS